MSAFGGKADIALDRRRQTQAIPDQETGVGSAVDGVAEDHP